jgi:transcriptional regulator with XRE-family HTH domain
MPRRSSVPKVKHVVTLLRQELGLRQEEFAKRVGLSRRTLQNVEYGKALSWKSARAITEQFNVSPDWLMQNDPSKPMTTISGKPWSHKERNNLQPFKNRTPHAKVAAWVISERALRPLLEDYVKFRSYFTFAVFTDPSEMERWREIQGKAWNEFLEDNPVLAELSKETFTGDVLSRADLESIKEDVEMVIQMPPLPEKEAAKKRGSEKEMREKTERPFRSRA